MKILWDRFILDYVRMFLLPAIVNNIFALRTIRTSLFTKRIEWNWLFSNKTIIQDFLLSSPQMYSKALFCQLIYRHVLSIKAGATSEVSESDLLRTAVAMHWIALVEVSPRYYLVQLGGSARPSWQFTHHHDSNRRLWSLIIVIMTDWANDLEITLSKLLCMTMTFLNLAMQPAV